MKKQLTNAPEAGIEKGKPTTLYMGYISQVGPSQKRCGRNLGCYEDININIIIP